MPNPLLKVQNSCLGWFRAISLPHVTHSENGCHGAFKARVFVSRTISTFFATNNPIYYFSSKTHVWGDFAQFRCCTSPIPETAVGVHTKHDILPPEPFLRFSQRTCPIHYFRSKTHVWGGFAQFHCRTSPIPKTGVGVHTKHEFLPPEPFLLFSQRTCPINYFRSKTHVWGGFAQFCCRTSPIPKTCAGCIQSTSFCQRNHFFVFRNEHAQSTTLGQKLMFGVVLRNFVAACDPFRKQVSKCIQRTSFCHRNQLFVFRNKHAQCTTLGPKLMFGMVSLNFIVARHLFRKLVSGCIQIMSFCKRNHFFVFATSMPNPPLYVQNPCLWWFHAILLPHVTYYENGCLGAYKARVFATGTISLFFATNNPIYYFRSKTHVWGGFAQFRCRTSPIPKTAVVVHTKHEIFPPEPFLRFLQRTCPIHYFRFKTHGWGGFAQFCCRMSPIPKTGLGL
jgi:hypothetical protein